MTRPLLTLLGCFIILTVLGQTEVNNTRTDKHRQIVGTKFLLIPPENFTDGAGFQGFQQASSGASILFMEIPVGFRETAKSFTDQNLRSKGVMVKTREEVKINGNPGLLLTTEQNVKGNSYIKYVLIFGDAKITYMMNGTFSKESMELDKPIRDAMFSIIYDSELTTDPLAGIPFTLDTKDTRLGAAKNMAGTLVYMLQGDDTRESSDKTSFIAGRSMGSFQAVDKRQTAIERIKKMPYAEMKFDESKITEVQIDGLSGYEIVGEGQENPKGPKDLVYMVMLFSDDSYYLLLGVTNRDFEQNIELFRAVAKSFKRK